MVSSLGKSKTHYAVFTLFANICEIKWSNNHFLNYYCLIRFGNLLIKTKDKELEKGQFNLGKHQDNTKLSRRLGTKKKRKQLICSFNL